MRCQTMRVGESCICFTPTLFKVDELTHLLNLPISDITLLTCDQWRRGVVILLTGVQDNRPYVQKIL